MLREDRRRDIYEGAGPGGKIGSGVYYVSYSSGQGPTLTRLDIENLLAMKLIKEKFTGFYVLS